MSNYKCDICGKEFKQLGVWRPDINKLVCNACDAALHSCRTCINLSKCAAQENKDNIQSTITRQLPNGAIVQTENPELIHHYCNKEHCGCGIDMCCMKQESGYCANWELNPNIN